MRFQWLIYLSLSLSLLFSGSFHFQFALNCAKFPNVVSPGKHFSLHSIWIPSCSCTHDTPTHVREFFNIYGSASLSLSLSLSLSFFLFLDYVYNNAKKTRSSNPTCMNACQRMWLITQILKVDKNLLNPEAEEREHFANAFGHRFNLKMFNLGCPAIGRCDPCTTLVSLSYKILNIHKALFTIWSNEFARKGDFVSFPCLPSLFLAN